MEARERGGKVERKINAARKEGVGMRKVDVMGGEGYDSSVDFVDVKQQKDLDELNEFDNKWLNK